MSATAERAAGHSAPPLPTERADLIARLQQPTRYDLAVVGGGATGLGVALEAVSRGLRVVLVESHDFAKGTSSRATKLLHGGVRYLAQGNISLVYEALHERTTLLRNAPHVAQPLRFVVPSYRWWETPFYGAGLTLYDVLAGKSGLGTTRFLNRTGVIAAVPGVKVEGLRSGVQYWDGQFDDARLAITLAKSAASAGALLVNYCEVKDLLYEFGKVSGIRCIDRETGQTIDVFAGCVVNAAGVWVDELRQKDAGAGGSPPTKPTQNIVAPSQGVHVVIDADFLPGGVALMVPKTADGRVLFAVPWLGKVILGTTDTAVQALDREPRPLQGEVDFILREAGRYLQRPPAVQDVRSTWVGLRPLVKPPEDPGAGSKSISREHTILISGAGLVTVTGGKWTTYRAMAEDVMNQCFAAGLLNGGHIANTSGQHLSGYEAGKDVVPLWMPQGLHSYGAERQWVQSMEGADEILSPGFTAGMVRYAARFEYARTVEDVLARRCRLLFLDAKRALELSKPVAEILQSATGKDPQCAEFNALATQYLQRDAKSC